VDDEAPYIRSTNFEVARLFDEIARSLDVAGEHGHRPRAYRRAARGVAGFPEPLERLAEEGRLRSIPGIGPSLEALIAEFLRTGGMRTHVRLVSEHPPGLAPLLAARGFGPAGVHALYEALGVTALDAVERAGAEGHLARVLGPKRAADLEAQLPSLRNPVRTMRLKPAWEIARQFEGLLLSDRRRRPRRLEIAGAARRMCEMVEGGLDFVAIAGPSGPTELLDLVASLPGIDSVLERTEDRLRLRLYDGLEVRLRVADDHYFGTALLQTTGSPAHVARLRQRAWQRGIVFDTLVGESEEAIYAALDLPLIPAELREDDGEIEAALVGALPTLVCQADLRGDLHCHTHWTDGSASLEDMARAARARGYEYMALTDHSRSLTITNGLSLERLEDARREVHQLNERLAPFVVLLGTEMDILEDGALDYPDEVLATLDYVSASIHSRFRQPLEVMTARIERAVSHPLVHTLNHPHGRLLGMRPAYAVDMPRVVERCAASGCAMEVSADPARMDLDGGWARRVRAAGGLCTISSDAHSTLDYDNIWLGVGSARRGWLEARQVVNTRSLEDMRAWLRRRTPQ
jgi:DNA polymerase (family 10)